MTKRAWTEAEIEYLKDNIGYAKISTIAERLSRTETSVELKIKRLGLSNTKSFSGQLTMHELATLLKVDSKTVKLWMQNHGLPFTKRATRNIKQFYFIRPDEFWKWAFLHKDRVDFSKIERQSIVPEPQWVDCERQHKKSTNYKAWTTREINLMLDLLSAGSNFNDIGKELNRSPISIQRKYYRVK